MTRQLNNMRCVVAKRRGGVNEASAAANRLKTVIALLQDFRFEESIVPASSLLDLPLKDLLADDDVQSAPSELTDIFTRADAGGLAITGIGADQ